MAPGLRVTSENSHLHVPSGTRVLAVTEDQAASGRVLQGPYLLRVGWASTSLGELGVCRAGELADLSPPVCDIMDWGEDVLRIPWDDSIQMVSDPAWGMCPKFLKTGDLLFLSLGWAQSISRGISSPEHGSWVSTACRSEALNQCFTGVIWQRNEAHRESSHQG